MHRGPTVACTVLFAALGIAAPAGAATPTAKSRLVAFKSCDGLQRYARHHALGTMKADRYGAHGGGPVAVAEGGAEGGGSAPQTTSAPAAGAPRDVPFSGTNVQEEGIDEPDEVKTDGAFLYAAARDAIQVVDVRAGATRVVGRLRVEGHSHRLLLQGDRLLVLSDGEFAAPAAGGRRAASESTPSGYRQGTTITEVDVSDPADPRVRNRMEIDGRFVGARLAGGSARIVIASVPAALDHALPAHGQDPEEARAARRQKIYNARSSLWRPTAILTRRSGPRRRRGTTARPAVHCRSVRHARRFSGLDVLTVLTVDVGKGLPEVDSDALLTTAETVYASHGNLYVATQQWLPGDASASDVPDGVHTLIHRFATRSATETSYRASGRVRGYLLGQFSLSEHQGVLRAATTSMPTWIGGRDTESESFVTTLDERDGKLVEVGSVAGLGRGERIYAVRFMGDTGYVVTFRQTDPLYTIDLGDPAKPRVRGELKIMGYSAYLHPIGDGLLIGIGQDATADGRRQGAQLSLFDVSDLSAPARLHQAKLGRRDSSSSAEYDHHAFLWWPATSLLAVPLQSYGRSEEDSFFGAVAYTVGRAGGFTEAGAIEHEPRGRWDSMVRRSLVVGDRLLTVSDRGVAAHALDGLTPRSFAPFAG